MKYSPGSFSKNFGWHGTGLRKLHQALRSGFGGKLLPVAREDWRRASGISDASRQLIPVNFFLHNRNGEISVDELVFRAVRHQHSIEFDRLALFALHLNRAGSGLEIVERPAMWANEFVRNSLWANGSWRASALTEQSMDAFIAAHMNATPRVRIKCRSNYRHLYELCQYLPASLPVINSGLEQSPGSALFLAWDRHILDGGQASKAALLKLLRGAELHKLLGTSAPQLASSANILVDIYLNAGNVGRFALPPTAAHPSIQATAVTAQAELPEERTSQWIDQDESDAAVERRTIESQAQVRDRKKAAALKSHYSNMCTFCDVQLQIASGRFYSEAAHVKALGKPHNGPDKVRNMIVLCPNHHLQFDRGVLRLKKTRAGYVIQSRVKGDKLHGKQITLKHKLDPDLVQYHAEWHGKNWR